jgi:hypothetical protein
MLADVYVYCTRLRLVQYTFYHAEKLYIVLTIIQYSYNIILEKTFIYLAIQNGQKSHTFFDQLVIELGIT